MAYGNQQRLGDTIAPQLGAMDFSGFANAGMIKGQSIAGLGKDIAGGMNDYSNMQKEIKKQEQVAKSIAKAFEGQPLGEMANEALAQFSNPDLSTRDKSAIAASIGDALRIGVMADDRAIDKGRWDEEMKYKWANLEASQGGGSMGTIYTPDQLDELVRSGAKVDAQPTGDGRFFVKDLTYGSQPLVSIGGSYVDEQGNIQSNQQQAGGFRGVPGAGQQSPSVPALPLGAGTQEFNGGYSDVSQIPPMTAEQLIAAGARPEEVQGLLATQEQLNAPDFNKEYPLLPDRNPDPVQQRAATGIANAATMAPFTKFYGELPVVGQQGNMTGVTRASGSKAEQDYAKGQLEIEKARLEAEKLKRENEGGGKKEKGASETAQNKAKLVVQELNRAIKLQDKNVKGEGVSGSVAREFMSKIPGSTSWKVNENSLKTIDANTSFDALQEMRANSPTGGALGSIAVQELELLKATRGKLAASQDPETFKQNAMRLQEQFLDTAYGSVEKRKQLLDEGKLTPQENAEIESMYPPVTMDMQGNVVPRKKAVEIGIIQSDIEAELKRLGL